jgi:myo-inositol-1(or 4)-monophosphatase
MDLSNLKHSPLELMQAAQTAASLGREVLLNYFGQLSQVSEKKNAGLVTEADVQSEKVISDYLQKKYPEYSILAEEEFAQNPGTVPSKSPGRWIIDPLDGTTNFVHQFPVFCISIGFEYEGEIVAGVIDAPKLDEVFCASFGGGAFVNDEQMSVSRRKELSDCLLATGFFAYQKKESVDQQIDIFTKLLKQCRGIRRPGAAAYDMCMVAKGVFDGFWEKNLNPWDTAAGTILVKEAGGVVTNYDGQDFSPMMNSVVASNPGLHSELLKHLP